MPQARIPLAQAFGGGEVASADGLRFVVPVRTLNAGPNSKYFHTERGVTYYNFTSNQFSTRTQAADDRHCWLFRHRFCPVLAVGFSVQSAPG